VLVRDDTGTPVLYTAREGVLLGTVRDLALRLCPQLGIKVVEMPPTMAELQRAEEVRVRVRGRARGQKGVRVRGQARQRARAGEEEGERVKGRARERAREYEDESKSARELECESARAHALEDERWESGADRERGLKGVRGSMCALGRRACSPPPPPPPPGFGVHLVCYP